MLEINANLIWVIVNVIIIFLIFKKILYKPLMDTIQRREDLLKSKFDQAETEKKAARQLKMEYEAHIADAKVEYQQIVEEAKERGRAEYNNLVQKANEKSREITEKASAGIETERLKAMQDAQTEIASLALMAAAQIMNGSNHSENNEQLYNQFLGLTGEKHDTNSH